jgi:maltooligosyltrehalose trehalohydrolase
MPNGAICHGDAWCRFELWAPRLEHVQLELLGSRARRVAMARAADGTHRADVDGVEAHARYVFHAGDARFADPASRSQPEGVHGPSVVVSRAFDWTDHTWRGLRWRDAVIYELHVGTFTAGGTFDTAIAELDDLAQLGITAVEVMPVAQFPGARNWGYDGVFPFAVAAAYGGPDGLRRFVDACHARAMAVILDVVYNHFGPEGSDFDALAPFHATDFRTPWGDAINFDGPGSDGVRRFFLDNAHMWLADFHIDGLRLDAVHGIVDRGPRKFLAELADETAELGRATWRRWLVAESDANDPALVRPSTRYGVGLDAVWADDFHHAVHVLLTGERDGYYADYVQRSTLVRAIERGFAYAGEYSAFRDRRHGALPTGLPPEAFVVCVQNHDQIGNRLRGDRLTTLVSPQAARLAAALLLLSPHVPLVFMGEEYGETRPFLYFTDHGDPALVDAVRKGRRAEFARFGWTEDPPDPQDVETMRRCVLCPHEVDASLRATRRALFHSLTAVRRRFRFDASRDTVRADLDAQGRVLVVRYGDALTAVFHLSADVTEATLDLGDADVVLDGGESGLGGEGSVLATVLEGPFAVALPPFWFALVERG